MAEYRQKRDLVYEGLKDRYEIVRPGGVFSKHDSHFRLSYAADEGTLRRGVEVLRRLA